MEFNATFIASAISFIVFTIIMNAIFYKPLEKVVSERKAFIDDTMEEAKLHSEKSEALLKDKAKKIENTKHDAKKIIVDKADEVKNKKAVMTSEAQQKAVKTIDAAKTELQKSKDESQEVLSKEAQKLAQDISSKIMGKA
jgi:F-type H+-transporting ATPase subunit b